MESSKAIDTTIRDYLLRSAGNGNQVSDFTIRCFIGMLETGEARLPDFKRNAAAVSQTDGQWLIRRMMLHDAWRPEYEQRYA